MAQPQPQSVDSPCVDDEVLEGQYFGVVPARFVDDVCNAIGDYLSDAIDAAERAAALEAGDAGTAARVRQAADALTAAFKPVCDKNFDRFELYASRNVFALPEGAAQRFLADRAAAAAASARCSEEEQHRHQQELEREHALEQQRRLLQQQQEQEEHVASPVGEAELLAAEAARDAEIAELETRIAAAMRANAVAKLELREGARELEAARATARELCALQAVSPDAVQKLFQQARDMRPLVRDGSELVGAAAAAAADRENLRPAAVNRPSEDKFSVDALLSLKSMGLYKA
jgi:hypothetical protein